MSDYMKKREEYILSGFRAGDETGTQRTADYIAIALNSPDVMGKDTLGAGRINFTIGSALDLFGGNLSFEKVNIMLQNN